LPDLVEVEAVELGRVEIADLGAARVHDDDRRVGERRAEIFLEARVRLVRVRDEEAVPDAPDPRWKDLHVAPAQVADDLDLAEEPLGDRPVLRDCVPGFELLERRHRLHGKRHVDEPAVEHL
jgi:hypothetical protein